MFHYSSQPDQRSFGYPLDPTEPDRRWQGSFTPALTQALRADTGASRAQVLAATRDTMQRGAVRQDPDGEATLLQAAVFGNGPPSDRYPAAAGVMQAGLLAGLAEGAEVTLCASAAGGDTLGQAHLRDVKAVTARLDPAPPPKARLGPR